jgi:hypothetical protein
LLELDIADAGLGRTVSMECLPDHFAQRFHVLIDDAARQALLAEESPARRKAWLDLLRELVEQPVEDQGEILEELLGALWAKGVYGKYMPARLIQRRIRSKEGEAAMNVIDRALAVLENRPLDMTPEECRDRRHQLEQWKRTLRQRIGTRQGDVVPWEAVEALYECADPMSASGSSDGAKGIRVLARTVADGPHAYVLAVRFIGKADEVELVLLRLLIAGGTAREISSLAVPTRRLFQHNRQSAGIAPYLSRYAIQRFRPQQGNEAVADAVIANGCFYAATKGCGIIAFPLDGREPWSLDARNGLPSNCAQHLAVHEPDLYVWLGKTMGRPDAYLVRISLEDHGIEVVASSERSTGKSILDGVLPPKCFFMMIDEPRDRLVFGLTIPAAYDQRAIYQLDFRTDALSKLTDYHRKGQFRAARPQGDDAVLLLGSRLLCRLDLETDSVAQLYRDNRVNSMAAPILLRDDHVWTANPFGRVRVATDEFEAFPDLRQGQTDLRATCIELDDEQILLQNSRSLWLIRLTEPSASTNWAPNGCQLPKSARCGARARPGIVGRLPAHGNATDFVDNRNEPGGGQQKVLIDVVEWHNVQ